MAMRVPAVAEPGWAIAAAVVVVLTVGYLIPDFDDMVRKNPIIGRDFRPGTNMWWFLRSMQGAAILFAGFVSTALLARAAQVSFPGRFD